MIPVSRVPGIGPKTTAFLAEHEVTTAEGLLRAGMALLVTAPGFHEARARSVLADAALLLDTAQETAVAQAQTGAREVPATPDAKDKVKKKKKKKSEEKSKPKKKNKKTKKDKKGKKTKKKDKKKKK